MKLPRITGWVLNPMQIDFLERERAENRNRKKKKGEGPCEEGGREWGCISTRQSMPKVGTTFWNHQKTKEAKKILPWSLHREHGPTTEAR